MGASELIDELDDCALIIDYNSQTDTAHISSYTPLTPSTVPSSIFYAYLSACDLSILSSLSSSSLPSRSLDQSPLSFPSVFSLSPVPYIEKPDSTIALDHISTFLKDRPKRKYKPVSQKDGSIIAERPEKS